MVHASLFSGIGGFDLAAEWIGWQNAFHCEINPFGQRVLKYHFPNSESYDDITKTDFTKWRGRVDIITGGFPCQPFSLAGKRKGTADDRYLWPQMLRVIREINPTWVVGENVAGIVSMVQPGEAVEVGRTASLFGEDYKDEELRQQYVVETVCADLEREGYSVQPVLIPACAVGAPHRWDRIWFIAHRNSDRWEERGSNSDRTDAFLSVRRNVQLQPCGFGKVELVANGADTRLEAVQRERQDGVHAVGTSADSQSTRSEGKCEHRQGEIQFDGRNRKEIQTCWAQFPTQPPVCSRDDGIPRQLDSITFPKWREESIKAYGNAIVPQVAYEIFTAINRFEQEKR